MAVQWGMGHKGLSFIWSNSCWSVQCDSLVTRNPLHYWLFLSLSALICSSLGIRSTTEVLLFHAFFTASKLQDYFDFSLILLWHLDCLPCIIVYEMCTLRGIVTSVLFPLSIHHLHFKSWPKWWCTCWIYSCTFNHEHIMCYFTV